MEKFDVPEGALRSPFYTLSRRVGSIPESAANQPIFCLSKRNCMKVMFKGFGYVLRSTRKNDVTSVWRCDKFALRNCYAKLVTTAQKKVSEEVGYHNHAPDWECFLREYEFQNSNQLV
ncbi:uncharacterized protein LOC120351413 [Nilaparvata lugens]|uniref:uncharacterized protein LOC120351413 n=1 Tax=Nilaparvata lugens TaxID=108931 RepID=UPI00193DBA40|nr:uncharacterized protein LOC120351413 [Nilaparvata lugens]